MKSCYAEAAEKIEIQINLTQALLAQKNPMCVDLAKIYTNYSITGNQIVEDAKGQTGWLSDELNLKFFERRLKIIQLIKINVETVNDQCLVTSFSLRSFSLRSFFCFVDVTQSAVDEFVIRQLAFNATDSNVVEQCGVSINVSPLKMVSDQVIGFGCTGSYMGGNQTVMHIGFQYDPNFDPRGGDNISFFGFSYDLSVKILKNVKLREGSEQVSLESSN